jgi:hypothetical protein
LNKEETMGEKKADKKGTAPDAAANPRTMGPWSLALVVLLGAAAIFIAVLSRRPFPATNGATVTGSALAEAQAPAEAPAAPVATPVVVRSKKPAAQPVVHYAAATPVARETRVRPAAQQKSIVTDRSSLPEHSVAAEKSIAAELPASTITGCLEQSGDGAEVFRLTDTSGADTPKARSWKSGFLKKAPAPIGVVDAAHSLNLSGYVGQRVSVSGRLEDREMQARSLRRVAASCD